MTKIASRGGGSCLKSILFVGANSTSLVKFLLAEWSTNANVYAPKLHNRFLVITCGEACVFLASCDGSSIVKMSIPELCSTHEEADTCLLLHAAHASRQGFANVVIRSPDTDVAVLAISFSADIAADLFFCTGVKNRTHVMDSNLLSENTAKPSAEPCQMSTLKQTAMRRRHLQGEKRSKRFALCLIPLVWGSGAALHVLGMPSR